MIPTHLHLHSFGRDLQYRIVVAQPHYAPMKLVLVHAVQYSTRVPQAFSIGTSQLQCSYNVAGQLVCRHQLQPERLVLLLQYCTVRLWYCTYYSHWLSYLAREIQYNTVQILFVLCSTLFHSSLFKDMFLFVMGQYLILCWIGPSHSTIPLG